MHLRRLIPLLVLASLTLADAAQAQVLYWIDTNFNAPTLNKADALGNAIASVPLALASLPEGLAVDASGKVYWGEAWLSGARINRAAPTLTSMTPLSAYGSSLRGVAVDDVAGTIYWTSSNLVQGSRITRSALDGSGETILLQMGSTANPRGIAVDHAGGKIYWADFDNDVIVQANLDGTAMTQWLFVPTHAGPFGVAIDPIARQIYWTEFAGKIRRAPLSGGAATSLIGGLSQPTYLALDPSGGQMYWSEGGAGNQHIYRGPMAGGTRTVLSLPLTTYGGLAFQPNGTVSAEERAPSEFALATLSPNPSVGRVRAAFDLPREAQARVTVIDLQGREVAVLADRRFPAGRHVTYWNPSTRVPAGVYFVRLATDGRAWVRRFIRAR